MSIRFNTYKWISVMYLMQGIPFALITIVAPVLYKDFNFNNSDIAFYTSLWMLPWILKFLIAPVLEQFNKRYLLLSTQIMLGICIILLALSFSSASWAIFAGISFTLIAILGAIYDINSDGFYLSSLTYSEQANLVGFRSLCYQLGKLICRFGLLFMVGYFSSSYGKEKIWSFSFLLLAGIVFFITFYEQKKLPNIPKKIVSKNSYHTVIKEFCQLPNLIPNIMFVLLFELPNAQLTKIVPLFMMDSAQNGGLQLGIESISLIYGALGMISMLIGMTLAGFLLNLFTLKKCLIPFSILTSLCYMSYLSLSYHHSLTNVTLCIMIAELGFGLSNGAYMLYLVRYFSQGSHSMSLYAIGTVIMLLGIMLAGSISGFLQLLLGYKGFFQWIVFLNLFIIFLTVYHVKKVLP